MQYFKEIDEIEEEIKKMKNLDSNQLIKFERDIKGYKPSNGSDEREKEENKDNLQKLIDESYYLTILFYSSVSDSIKEKKYFFK